MSHVITSQNNLRNNRSTPVRPIKIKTPSPRNEVKVHTLNITETSVTLPELAIRGSSLQNPADNDNKINQAWNRLKVNALSKAIAIAPDVVMCTLGPNSLLDCEHEENVMLDLNKAVTSTPFRPKPIEVNNQVRNISRIRHCLDITPEDDEIKKLESLKNECLSNIETQIVKCGERKKEEQLKKWMENDAKIKEMLVSQKMEMERERQIRIQKMYIESQDVVTQSKETSMQVKNEELKQSKSDHDKRLAEKSERRKEIEQKQKELEEKQKQKKEELKRCKEGIYKVRESYGKKYLQISEITRKCKNDQMLYGKVVGDYQKLKEMGDVLTDLIGKCGDGKVTLQDLKSAENLVHQITVIRDNVARHVEQINILVEKADEDKKQEKIKEEQRIQEELKAKQVEADKQKQKEESERIVQEKSKVAVGPVKISGGIEDCVSGDCLKWHLELSRYLEEYEQKLEPLLANESFKKFRFDCQKVVNVPVNAISPTDDLHLEDKWYKLSRLLQGQAVPLGTTLFLATGHPLGVAYCTNLLAEKFVKQGEHVVSSKPKAAFAIAAVIVSLWAEFPHFGRLLLAHFHRECPYLIPAFLPQTEGQTDQDYYKMLGYQYTDDGKVEPQNKFLRRMSGVMRLYAAVLVTPLKRSLASASPPLRHPHDMVQAWRWLSATLNLSPRPDITATLTLDFLEVTGFMFYRTYGLQFTKLLHILCTDYFSLIEKITPDGCGGPVVRLKTFLERVLKGREVHPPTELLPPNFW